MANSPMTKGVAGARLAPDVLKQNFSDLHPPLDAHGAAVAADRCYFCFDAPCVTACPTTIDIPLFIRQIHTGNKEAAAHTIFDQNILGGMCARVCPTETLCEEACVREIAEGNAVEIGLLQRFATDALMASGVHPYKRPPATGKKIAVVGAGPAGLACAHRLAMKGHSVEILDPRSKAGGLNEFGIAAYKSVDDFAANEVEWLLKIGGIDLQFGQSLGQNLALSELMNDYDAVFLGMGLAGVNALRTDGEEMTNVIDAVEFISELRQAKNWGSLNIGRNVVVIGGGMTAVDAAVQSKLLGAENVTMIYRRSRDRMSASDYEIDLAAAKGVHIIYGAMPVAVHGNGSAAEVEFEYTTEQAGRLVGTGEVFRTAADQVFKAIGQRIEGVPDALEIDDGKILVTGNGRTSMAGVWAGGDCASGGDDLTVTAVAEGRDAAEDIHLSLSEKET